MKTAIVYYSMCGNTAFVAEKIKEALTDVDLIEITPVKSYPSKGIRKFLWGGKSAMMAEKPALNPYKFNADDYEHIVIGFPVWASRVAPPIRSFIEENRVVLQTKSISAYACQAGNGAEKALKNLKEIIPVSDFSASMILIDPKDKPTEDNERKIREFCKKL